jgi:hypothetical protein
VRAASHTKCASYAASLSRWVADRALSDFEVEVARSEMTHVARLSSDSLDKQL